MLLLDAVTRSRRVTPDRAPAWAAAIACALLALAGCADGPAPVTPRPPASPAGPTASAEATAAPPSIDATLPVSSSVPGESAAPTTLACRGTAVAFRAAALGSLPELLPLSPEGRALAAYAGTDAGRELGLPRDGWFRVSAAPTGITFIAPSGGGWAFATIGKQADGAWDLDEGGPCELAARTPASLGFAPWRLEPAGRPAADSTRLSISAREEACADGRAPGGRLLAPVVDETATTVTVTLLVVRLPSADCPGNPRFPVEVALSRPVGSRALLDGSSYPAARRE